tara:strand:+ start:362 stop:580 length:219 start_codon:yes stop_codon:yes gene_type:complete
MERKLTDAINLQRERDEETKKRVISIYKEMLRHYYTEGIGERSKYAGCIIKQRMIDSLERRIAQLGVEIDEL